MLPQTETQLRVLIVDDELIMHQTVGSYLRHSGLTVDRADDGAAAMTLLDERDYDLVLADLCMPKIDGLKLLTRLKQTRPDLPIAIVSGHANPNMRADAKRLGATYFMDKPIDLLELDALVAEVAQGPARIFPQVSSRECVGCASSRASRSAVDADVLGSTSRTPCKGSP